jgi:transposase
VDSYLKVRQAHFQDSLRGRRIARDFGISRDSVAKMLAYSEPPGYRLTAPITRPKLDAFADQIDQWLAEDKVRPRKQRHTAKRIFERLRDECGFDGGYTIVKDYARLRKRTGKEMFNHCHIRRDTLRRTLVKRLS